MDTDITELFVKAKKSFLSSISHKTDHIRENIILKSHIGYVNHDPIIIDSNENFSATAAIKGWPGKGTQSEPYIIEGLNITGPAHRDLLEISNTNVFFQIQNCIIKRRNHWNSLH